MQTLERLLRRDPERWKLGLLAVVKAENSLPPWSCFYDSSVDKDKFMLAATVAKMHQFNQKEMRDLLKRICDSLDDLNDLNFESTIGSQYNSLSLNKQLYISLVGKYMVTTLPIFQIPCQVNLRTACNLHLHQKRQTAFLEEITKRRNYHEIHKGPFQKPRPRFLFSTSKHSKMVPGIILHIVELRKCAWNPDGTAHILIDPIDKTELLRITRKGRKGEICYGHVRYYPP